VRISIVTLPCDFLWLLPIPNTGVDVLVSKSAFSVVASIAGYGACSTKLSSANSVVFMVKPKKGFELVIGFELKKVVMAINIYFASQFNLCSLIDHGKGPRCGFLFPACFLAIRRLSKPKILRPPKS
jgi:hypothetical protein